MKNLTILFTLALTIILTSCSKDEPNFVGVFNLIELELQCTSGNILYEEEPNGVCFPETDNTQNCFEWEFDIKLDGTFEELTITHSRSGNLVFSSPNRKEGTYTTVENQIIFTYPEGTTKELTMNDSETSLSGFLVDTASTDCEIRQVFSRN